MVAISLYRGNLHRVSDAPRRWPMPPPAISLQNFRLLTSKRAQALSRLPIRDANPEKEEEEDKGKEEGVGDSGCAKPDLPKCETASISDQTNGGEDRKEGEGLQESKVIDASATNLAASVCAGSEEGHGLESGGGGTAGRKMEVGNNLDTASDKEKRKSELERKLHVLNEKKHHLVQMLKQILNAEEEFKRRSTQSSVINSDTRHVPKLSVEVNFGGDLGAESDATANHNTHARQLHHMHSTSPSAISLTRPLHGPFQQNAMLPAPRASLLAVGHGQTPSNMLMGSGAAAAASPSRFAQTAQQTLHHSTSLPSVSAPGTHFIASSPSPAGSGGASSVFRDSHLTRSS